MGVGVESGRISKQKLDLLESIRRTGRLTKACEEVGVSYRTGINWLRELREVVGGDVVRSVRGGRGGGGMELTRLGVEVLERAYLEMAGSRPGMTKSFIESRMSARNVLSARVKEVFEGDVVSMVVVVPEPMQEVKAITTTESVKKLGLKPGDHVYLIIKATEAMVMKP
jgi:molybdate transport system regulatory protein